MAQMTLEPCKKKSKVWGSFPFFALKNLKMYLELDDVTGGDYPRRVHAGQVRPCPAQFFLNTTFASKVKKTFLGKTWCADPATPLPFASPPRRSPRLRQGGRRRRTGNRTHG